MDRFLKLTPFRMFAVAGLIGMIAIGGASLLASQRSGENEAISEVRNLTQVVARTVVEPNLSSALLAGDPEAVGAMDRIMFSRVLDDKTVRVKVWDKFGRIVYSDEPELIGEIYELDDEKNASLRTGEVVTEISSLSGPENRFEASAGQLLEVYFPIDGPDGDPLLYEAYFAMSVISDSSERIRSEFVPIIVGAVVLMEAMHLALAWGLNRRMRRAQAERERLLQRAIDSSEIERRRIAADLHDGVIQDLVGTSFAVAAAAHSAELTEPRLAEDLHVAATGTRRSLQSLRSLLVDIYPPNLLEHGLEAALLDLLAPATMAGIETELSIAGDPDKEAVTVMLIYRVVQEAIRNVLRHAEASKITVDITATSTGTSVLVTDDGRGFAESERRENGHMGLRLLTDLTADAGASFLVDSRPGQGTVVDLMVPA